MSRKLPRITPAEIQTIKDAQAGSMKAFNRIFYQYKGFVDSVLYAYTKDMDEAKDNVRGIESSAKDTVTGETYTYTLPCGAALPEGAVCTCNCVTGRGGCSCVGHSNSGGGGGSHYWHPN